MKKIFLYSTLLLSLASCSLDDNLDPNLPQMQNLDARSMITAAQTTSYDAHASGMNELSNVFSNIWAGNVYYFASPYAREFNLNIDNNFYSGIWNNLYLSTANLQYIIDSPKNDKLPLHKAVAKILKANNMQYIVDLYGDAPYSEAFKGQQVLSPKYDLGEEIYKKLVLELNDAINTIDNTTQTSDNKVSEDVIFGGDMTKWKAFANTIKLRILLRQSNVNDATIKSFVDTQLATLSGASFVDYDVKINPGYSSATTENFNPLYREYGRVLVDHSTNTQGWRVIKASDHYAKSVSGDASYPTSGVVDKRGTKQFLPVGGKVEGIVQGAQKISGKVESNFSFLGWKFGVSNANGGLNNASMDGYLMLKSEAKLLLSEAATLYPAYFSNAKTNYDDAVRESFVFYGLTTADADAYLTALDTKTVGWTGAPNKIAAIQYQRFVSLANLRSIETYINYIKTGYPNIPLATTAQQPRKPYRLIYPVSEYTGNTANVPKMQNTDAFTINQYSPFWLRK